MQPTRFSKLRYGLLLGSIFFIYILDSSVKMFAGHTYFASILKPILWLGVILLVWLFPMVRPRGKLKTGESLCIWSFCFAFIMIVTQIMAGFFDGFGKSPYDRSMEGILINTLSLAPVIIGRELVRNYLVNSITREESYRVFIGITILMTIIIFPVTQYTSFKTYEELTKFVAGSLAPELCRNLLATYVVFYGGALPSIIFMGTLEAFHWFSPILPNLKWITAAFVGILTPVFLLPVVQMIYEGEAGECRPKDREQDNLLSSIAMTLVSIMIVWFSAGVFPVYPSVIATGSMMPMIHPGDVILVDKSIDPNQLKEGTVIQFKRGDILISHRIIEEIVEKDKTKSYRTQGDNNSGPDFELVKPEDVRGEIIKVIPKIGWPTLLLKTKRDVPMHEIEF